MVEEKRGGGHTVTCCAYRRGKEVLPTSQLYARGKLIIF
jgi:hypothetical protein